MLDAAASTDVQSRLLYYALGTAINCPYSCSNVPCISKDMGISKDMVTSELELSYIHVMRGWQVLESDILSSGFDIVDFDLAPEPGCRSYESRTQVYHDLNKLFDEAITQKKSATLIEKVRASKAFAKALLEGVTDLREYLEDTQKVHTSLISEDVVQDYKRSCSSLLADLGISFDEAGFNNFMDKYVVHNQEEVRAIILTECNFWQQAIRERINFYDEVRLEITFVSKDEPWQVGLTGNLEAGTKAEINTHSRHRFTKGQCKYLASHEVAGHALQFAARERKISEGKLESYTGIVSIFNPDIAVSEGLAQTVPYFVAEETAFEPSFRVAKRLRELRDILIHNAHLMAETGKDIDECVYYCLSRSPFLTDAEVRTNVLERLESPLLKSYMACYAPWFLLFRQYIARMKGNNKSLNDLLCRLYLDFPLVEDVRRTLA
jgi:hypothetical protein